MKGTLGIPYKFFYAARGYTSGLTDIVALVNKPDGSSHATYPMQEMAGSFFEGTYYFDLLSTQNNPEGEYTVIVLEQTGLHKEVQKVSLKLPPDTVPEELLPELFGKLSSSVLKGAISSNQMLSYRLNDQKLVGSIEKDGKISGKIENSLVTAKLIESKLIAKITECTQ